MISRLFSLLVLPSILSALETKPWLNAVWECNGSASYTYSHFRQVADATDPLSQASNDHLLTLDLGFTPSEIWDVEAELELVDTPRQNFGYRSAALQGRMQWLNDIAGDWVSVITGLNVREVSSVSLRDVSCPYHSYVNVELNTSIGKEWSKRSFWKMRGWGFMGVGIANQGAPWLRLLGVIEKNWNNHHRLRLFTEGYVGLGSKTQVNIDHFHGWGRFDHQSVDVGLAYQYHFDSWGDLSVGYAGRIYAHVFPEYVQFFTFSYRLPFSVL